MVNSIFIILSIYIGSGLLGFSGYKLYQYFKKKNSTINIEDDLKENISEKIDFENLEIREKYKLRLISYNLVYSESIINKYDLGYVLFGIWQENYIQGPIKLSKNLDISAEWSNIEISLTSEQINRFKIKIPGFYESTFMITGEDTYTKFANFETTIMHAEVREEIEISNTGLSTCKMFFEIIDSRDPLMPIYLFGFQKKRTT